MGTWGTSLSSNDIYADIYYEFFELYDEGHDVKEISEKLVSENDFLDSGVDTHSFWFALAKAQWMCRALDPQVLHNVKEIIVSGSDIRSWQENGATPPELKKRKDVLQKLLLQLETPRKTARVRRKRNSKIYEPPYKKGDCLTFQLKDGAYGGIIILEATAGTTATGSSNLIAATDIHSFELPNEQDFVRAKILTQKWQDFNARTGKEIWRENPYILWHTVTAHKYENTLLKRIATLKVKKVYHTDDYDSGFFFTGAFNEKDIDSIAGYLLSKKIKTIKLKKYI